MPIVTHIVESSQQADGSTSNIVRMYDQDAKEYMQGFFAPAGFDVSAKVVNMIDALNQQLADTEFRALVGL